MSRRRLQGSDLGRWALALACAGCAGGGADGESLAQGDRVQVAASSLGPGWHAGTVGKAGGCTALFVASPAPPAPPRRFTLVALESVTAVRREGRALPVEALRRAYGGCRPF